ncbi:MAG: RHS repeat protein, partial [Proteobacteria bacterium]|nr:RHS repeat protein [Pseudomonadota bacterium]
EEILKGKPWLQLSKDLDGNLYSSVETKHEQRWMCQEDMTGVAEQILPYCSVYSDKDEHKDELIAFAVQTEAISGSWEKTTNPRYTGTKSFFNEWGSAVRSETYGEVTFAGYRTPGEGFDLTEANIYVGEDEAISETDFIYDVDKWLLNLPYEARTYDIGGQITSQSRTYYDGEPFVGLTLGKVMQGLATRSSVWLKTPPLEKGEGGISTPASERWIDTQRMKYNSDGLVVATMDANDNMAELEYDLATGSFPDTERFHVDLGPLEFTAEYDTGFGAITTATDLNGNTSRFYYDGLGRLTDIVDPLGKLSQPMSHYEYEYGTPEHPISTTTVRSLIDRQKDEYRTAWQFSDGLGRGRLTKTEAEAEHGYIGSGWSRLSPRGSATHVYDSFASTFNGLEAAPSKAPVTKSYMDALGRAVDVYPPATEDYGLTHTHTKYKTFETWVYDERDIVEGTWLYPAVTKVDGLGRVREILKHNDVGGKFTKLTWNVEYNPMGSITGFTDPQGNTRHYAYDSLQRMLSVDDPNVGDIHYTYDDVGNLIERVDALGQLQEFVYGKANRLMSAHMSNDAHGADDYSYKYHYDELNSFYLDGENLLGKLSYVEWPTGTHHVSYDKLDRLTTEVQTLWDGTSTFGIQNRDTFKQEYEYNAAGQILSQEVPGGLHLAFQHNARSLLSSVSGGLNGDAGAIFDGIRYDHRGSTLRTDARNGTSTCSWFDNRARLTGIMSGPSAEVSCNADVTKTNPSAFQQLVYSRTPTGLIKKIDDLAPAMPDIPRFNASYQYDRLYQLTGATTSDGTLNYTYDTIQNLTSRTTDPSPLFKDLPTGEFKYGERGAGPNQITTAGGKQFEYNAIGQMKEYNGFELYFDVESRLVKAKKPGYATIEYHYDDTGEKKVTVIKKPGEPDKVFRYVSGGYQIRDGKETWFVGGGQGKAEISKAEGLEVDLALLDELTAYVKDPGNHKKPVTAEYMDLDSDGDFDRDDLEIAEEGYWSGDPVGEGAEVWRYYHKDHLGGSTIITDSMGDVVSTQRYHPYGETAQRTGQKPIYGFAGGEIEEEEELGLVRFGARWYAPAIGRWVSGDDYVLRKPEFTTEHPLDSGLYSYSSNSPSNLVDQAGEFPVGPAIVFVVVVMKDLLSNEGTAHAPKPGDKAEPDATTTEQRAGKTLVEGIAAAATVGAGSGMAGLAKAAGAPVNQISTAAASGVGLSLAPVTIAKDASLNKIETGNFSITKDTPKNILKSTVTFAPVPRSLEPVVAGIEIVQGLMKPEKSPLDTTKNPGLGTTKSTKVGTPSIGGQQSDGSPVQEHGMTMVEDTADWEQDFEPEVCETE